jgi:prolyl oligopeptidase
MTLSRLVVAAVALPFTFGLALIGACSEPQVGPIPPLTTALPPSPGVAGKTSSGTGGHGMKTRKMDLVETINGVEIRDPYRWLEDADSPEVHEWTARQNERTRAFVDAIPGRERLKEEGKELLEIGYVTAPSVRRSKAGMRYFHTKREGAQNQPTLFVRDGEAGKDRVLLDTSALSADGTTALDWWYPSWDGALVAWGRSDSGSEESVLHVRDVATGKDLPDRIDRTRHASLAWLPDGKSFYYSRYPEPGTVPAGDEKYSAKIYLHMLGQDPKQDKLVYADSRDKTFIPVVDTSPNGRWLILRVHMGWDKSEVYIRDLAKGDAGQFVPVAVGAHAVFEPIARNDRLFIQTNDGAPRYKLYAVSYDKPERAAWKEIIAEGKDVLNDVTILKNEIVASYMHEGASRIARFGLDGKAHADLLLPGIGSAGASGAWDGDEAFLSFTSYVVPYQVYRVDLRAPQPKLQMWDRVGAKFAVDDVEVQRLYATSKDGTKVPMFVIAKKGLVRDGKNPTVLYGYGGFNINLTPAFSARALTSVKHGAVWVMAILRGGGEFGEDWHRAGMLGNKQNVFDDFYACAEALVNEKITGPDHLGIVGGSNGGLLVAVAATQRPELFRVGLSLVPLTDMVRYQRFRIARLWIPEYGDPDKAEDFKWLYAYSPYHHVKEGVRYPAMLFTTAESDSRVDPMHARKMAARLEEVQHDPSRPILLRVETKAGHGAGKPVSKLADELADELSFLLHELGVTL